MFRTQTTHRETKSGLSAEAGRSRRTGVSTLLRRNDREEMLNSRRRGNAQVSEAHESASSDDAAVIQDVC